MSRSTHNVLAKFAAAVVVFAASSAHAADPVVINFELTALGAPSQYVYRYTVRNVALGAPLKWFSIDFDTSLYAENSLVITSVGLGSWSEQILGSVLDNPAQYDAYKSGGSGLEIGSAQTGFTVQFTWLGADAPGSQMFSIYDAATLNIIASGLTTPVPEPAAAVMLLFGLGAVAAVRRRSLQLEPTRRHG